MEIQCRILNSYSLNLSILDRKLKMLSNYLNGLYVRRTHSPSWHLWEDYKWFLKKLGFSKVVLSIGGDEKIYEYPNQELKEVYLSDRMLLNKHKSDSFIQFWGEKSRFSKRRFNLNCDIAFESWVLATKRWEELNKAEYSFKGEALEQKNSSLEKARDLYLP